MIGDRIDMQCYRCVHLLPNLPDDPPAMWRCEAFPDGIPFKIVAQFIRHNEPIDGDRGILYELNPVYEGWEKRSPFKEMIERGEAKAW